LEINYPTYIIAELTGEVEQLVMQCRAKFNPERLSWPVDITLAGSSGIGVIKAGQSLEKVITALNPILKGNPLSCVSIDSIERFPNTGIFYLKPRQSEFKKLHRAILESGVEFEKSDFPFTAHCTVCCREKINEEDEDHLANLKLPETVTIDSFSIYQLHNGITTRLHNF